MSLCPTSLLKSRLTLQASRMNLLSQSESIFFVSTSNTGRFSKLKFRKLDEDARHSLYFCLLFSDKNVEILAITLSSAGVSRKSLSWKWAWLAGSALQDENGKEATQPSVPNHGHAENNSGSIPKERSRAGLLCLANMEEVCKPLPLAAVKDAYGRG